MGCASPVGNDNGNDKTGDDDDGNEFGSEHWDSLFPMGCGDTGVDGVLGEDDMTLLSRDDERLFDLEEADLEEDLFDTGECEFELFFAVGDANADKDVADKKFPESESALTPLKTETVSFSLSAGDNLCSEEASSVLTLVNQPSGAENSQDKRKSLSLDAVRDIDSTQREILSLCLMRV